MLDASVPWVHYMVTNIPGSIICEGEEVFAYVPDFAFFTNTLDTSLVYDVDNWNDHLHLIFNQTDYIEQDTLPGGGESNCDNVIYGRYGVVNPRS